MGYKVNNSGQWCFLYGIAANEAKVIEGRLQLYMIEKKQGQYLDGFVGTFAEMPVGNSATYTNSLFSFAERKPGDPVTRIHIMEIVTLMLERLSSKRLQNLLSRQMYKEISQLLCIQSISMESSL